MRRALFMLLPISVTLLGLSPLVRAQTSTAQVTVTYPAGWNMVGGPTGTDFSAATAVDAYGSGSYSSPNARAAVACQGYWAYFASPATVALAPLAIGPTQICPLQTGWNLVGDPFSGAAALPAGVTAYHWNPDAGLYQTVNAIPPGGAVWIQANEPQDLTLQYEQAAGPTPTTLVLSNPASSGPYQVHAGDFVKLLLPSAVTEYATTSSSALHLESAGITGPLTCITGSTSCGLTLESRFWLWRAVAAGTAFITVTPICGSSTCGAPSLQIEIVILP